MKNYPIDESEVPLIEELCMKHNLQYHTEPSLLPGMLWLSIEHPDPEQVLSPELWFCLGRSLEVKSRLMRLDETGRELHKRLNEHKEELIDYLP